jgi:hypothetical protein
MKLGVSWHRRDAAEARRHFGRHCLHVVRVHTVCLREICAHTTHTRTYLTPAAGGVLTLARVTCALLLVVCATTGVECTRSTGDTARGGTSAGVGALAGACFGVVAVAVLVLVVVVDWVGVIAVCLLAAVTAGTDTLADTAGVLVFASTTAMRSARDAGTSAANASALTRSDDVVDSATPRVPLGVRMNKSSH